MLVSLTSAGLMVLKQTLGVILGADIGTTLTVQIIAFKLSNFSLLIITFGYLWMIVTGKRPSRYFGQIFFGFGLIFYGMMVMAEAMSPLRAFPFFTNLLQSLGRIPPLGILVSLIFTGLVHSSAATIGIALTFAFQGLLDLKSALPIILGANIGTCVSALLASVGGTSEAKRVAWAHTLFKILIVLLYYPLLGPFLRLVELTSSSLSRQIANAHTLFNIFAAIIFLPLLTPYAKLISKFIPEKKDEETKFKPQHLDHKALDTPALALGNAQREILRMADLVQTMVEKAMDVLKFNDRDLRIRLVQEDDKVDILEEAITPYLASLSQEELTKEQSEREVMLLYIVDDLEHIGDIVSKSLMVFANRKIETGFTFSDDGFQEIKHYHGEVLKTLKMAINVLATFDLNLAKEVAQRRLIMNQHQKELHRAHINRLREGLKESLETSTIHLDVLSDLERINYHASNIAFAILGAEGSKLESSKKNYE